MEDAAEACSVGEADVSEAAANDQEKAGLRLSAVELGQALQLLEVEEL